MKYLIASNIAIDKIFLPHGIETAYYPGGAGLHALTGIKLWTDDVKIACGVGADWKEKIGTWIEENGIDTSEVEIRDRLTPLNSCTYGASGERIDKTVYGDEHYNSLDCQAGDLYRFFSRDKADAVYTFKDDSVEFWNAMATLKQIHSFMLLWEINARICIPEKLTVIREILSCCDAFSINRKEAFSLFGVDSEEKAIEQLQSLGMKMILFRTGAKGLYVLMDGNSKFFPSLEKDQSKVVDVTGCGNSSTAASLWAWNEGMDIDGIGNAANITSMFCLKQYSVMSVEKQKRELAISLSNKLKAEVNNG